MELTAGRRTEGAHPTETCRAVQEGAFQPQLEPRSSCPSQLACLVLRLTASPFFYHPLTLPLKPLRNRHLAIGIL